MPELDVDPDAALEEPLELDATTLVLVEGSVPPVPPVPAGVLPPVSVQPPRRAQSEAVLAQPPACTAAVAASGVTRTSATTRRFTQKDPSSMKEPPCGEAAGANRIDGIDRIEPVAGAGAAVAQSA